MDIAVTTRPVQPADRAQFCRLWGRLSPETVYRRFHAPLRRIPAEAVRRLVTVDHDLREAVVAVVGDEVVGVARYDRSPADPSTAEFAVLVEDGWQSRGVGRLLLTELAAVARSRGIGFFTGSVLGENRRALSALAAVYSGMRYEIREGSYQVRVPLGPLEATAERAA